MTADTEYVVNELMMFMFSKLDTDTSEDVFHVVDGIYGDEAVSDAKTILWGRYGLLAVLGRNVSRRTKLSEYMSRMLRIYRKQYVLLIRHIQIGRLCRMHLWQCQ